MLDGLSRKRNTGGLFYILFVYRSASAELLQLHVDVHAPVFCVYSYFESTVLVSVYLHVPVTVSVERSEHDAEGSGPVTEQHEQTVSQRLLRENTPPLVHCGADR